MSALTERAPLRALGFALMALAWCVQTPVAAQSSPSAFTGATRYDLARRVVGTIAPDPDDTGPLHYAAVRNTYAASGDLTRVETGELAAWQAETVAPSAWSGFTVYRTLDVAFDSSHRKVRETVSVGGAAQSVTQYSYDGLSRLVCTAVRMNPAVFGSLPAGACDQSSGSTDRITRNLYSSVGDLAQVRRGVGTPLEQAYVTYSYTPNGKQQSVVDANGNQAQFVYDGLDRLSQWQFPSATRPTAYDGSTPANALASAGAINTADYELYGYDANASRTSLRKRDGSVIAYSYDPLNRVKTKDGPGTAIDVTYGYDLQGHQLTALFTSGGLGITNQYDGFGYLTASTATMGGVTRALTYLYDADGNRIRVTHPDATYFTYDYDGLDRPNLVRQNGSASLFSYGYDAQGRRTGIGRGSSVATTSYLYDGAYGSVAGCQPLAGDQVAGRMTCINQHLAGTGTDQAIRFAYNAANQAVARTTSNDGYAWTGHYNVNRPYTTNGLNQYSAAGPAAFTYDANANLISDGSSTYGYDSENKLVSASGAHTATLTYDPMGRLFQVTGGSAGTTRFLYDGDALVAEYDGSGNLLRRYVHGPNADEPQVWYEGGNLRYLHADHQGSIIAVSDSAGTPVAIDAYDEYGIPQSSNVGRFQYTGQIWLPELGLYHYKARAYSPTLGRFMQTDPIGYKDQFNLYAYVGDDPVNRSDPSGLCGVAEGNTSFCSSTSPNGTPSEREFTKARRAAINEAWQQEKTLVEAGGSTRDWTPAQKKELIETGRVRGFQGHHQNTVNGNSLASARNPDNIRFMTPGEHAQVHLEAGGHRSPIRGVEALNRALRVMGPVTDLTGILSGRIRTDSWDNEFSDLAGVPSSEDRMRAIAEKCGRLVAASGNYCI